MEPAGTSYCGNGGTAFPPLPTGCDYEGDCHEGYHVHTCARMFHEGDADTDENVEELDEVIDLNGQTIAYFSDGTLADEYCAWMNSRARKGA